MLTVDYTLPELVAELQARLEGGTLAGLGPVMLASGPMHDAELAGRVLLADLDHLDTLAEHTGAPPDPERWALLTDDLHALLLTSSWRQDGETDVRDGGGIQRA
jgi:hypothetical protein